MPSLDDLPPRRICVIKPSALGDVVQALPVLGALRRRFPEASLSWVINRNLAGLLGGHPLIDELIPFERQGGAIAFVRLLRRLRRQRFDLVLDLQGLLRTGLMSAATGAARRIGMETVREGAGWFHNEAVAGTGFDRPAWKRYREVAAFLDPGGSSAEAALPIPQADRDFVARLLDPLPGPWLAVAPGARWATKRWPAEKYVAVADRAHKRLEASIVIVGSPAERDLCGEVASALSQRKGGDSVANLGGATSLRRLAAVLEQCQWVLTNDSGPLHLADAVGTPAVGLFTCTSPYLSGPPPGRHELVATRLACGAGYHKRCPLAGDSHQACHRELDVERVWDALERLAGRRWREAG